MAQIVSISIDLKKIDKSKIIEGKNGAKYYNLNVLVNDDFDKYNNNVSVTEPQTKQQREAKEKRTFLGNGRVIWSNAATPKAEYKEQESKSENTQQPQDDLPF